MKIHTLLIILLFTSKIYSQETACGLTDETTQNLLNCINSNFNFNNSIKLDKITNDILKKIGLEHKNFRVLSCNSVNNALAFNYNNERYIVADQIFLNYLNQNDKTNDYWFYLFILSHEIAHHLNGHTLKKENNLENKRQQELECDRFAGFILAKYGASKETINKILTKIPHPKVNNSTHPILNDRINSAYDGFNTSINDELKIIAKYKAQIENEYRKNELLDYYFKTLVYVSDFYYNGNFESLDKAITAYNYIIEKKETIIDLEAIANLYDFKNDFKNAKKYYDLLYLKTNNSKYALASFAVSYDGNLKFDKNLDNISINSLDDISSINNLVLYKISKKDYNSAKIILEQTVEKYKNINYTSNFNDKLNYLNILNNLIAYYIENNENLKLEYSIKILESKILEFTSVSSVSNLLYITNFNKTNFELKKIAPILKSYYYHHGVYNNRQNLFSESIVDFEFLKNYYPNSNVVIDGRYDLFQGINYMNLKDINKAEYHFNKIINENLNHKGKAYLNLGKISLEMNNLVEGKGFLEKSCALGDNEACQILKNTSSTKSNYNIENAVDFLKKNKGNYDVTILTYELKNEKWEKIKDEIGEVNIDLQSISYLKKEWKNLFSES